MKHIFPILILAAANVLPAGAETVSQKEASGIAHRFFNAARGEVMAKPKLVWNGKRLTTDRLFTPFYVYNNPSGGFVMVSAENKAFPILAYSLKDSFDPGSLSDTETALFKTYARHIENIRYDDRIPSEAIRAWGDLNGYINSILTSTKDITDPAISMEDADELLQYVENADTYNGYSFIYTPEQWNAMISDEFSGTRSVAIGIIDGDLFYPAVVNGKKGDFFRLSYDPKINRKSKKTLGRNEWMFSLLPTEYISEGYMASTGKSFAGIVDEDVEEDAPFSLLESLVEARAEEEKADELHYRRNEALNSMTEALEGEPIVRYGGGGHIEVLLPGEARVARVYSISGAFLMEKYFRNTNRVFVDISHEPTGFYILQILDSEGKPYSFKLYR